jgi:hypothetical protein
LVVLIFLRSLPTISNNFKLLHTMNIAERDYFRGKANDFGSPCRIPGLDLPDCLETSRGTFRGLTRGTEGRLPLAPSGGSQGVQRGAYPWLLQGAHKGSRGAPTPGSFRGLTRGTEGRLPLAPSGGSQGVEGSLLSPSGC